MAPGLKRVRFAGKQLPKLERALADNLHAVANESADQTARRYIEMLFSAPAVAAMSLTGDASSSAPELSLLEEKTEPLTNTVHVSYQQTFNDIPVYGAKLGVELTPTNEFVGIDGNVAGPPDVDTVPTVSVEAAGARLRELLGETLAGDAPRPSLALRFGGSDERWRLAHVFDSVMVRTQAAPERGQPYRIFLDAHTGEEIVRAPLFHPNTGVARE